jgi:DNA-binding CsgD family transcriptional regulator
LARPSEGLSDRESEILTLITQGKSNAEVAALTYLSPNTVKSYIRTIYRKIEVGSRTQAVLWGVKHGFTPDHHRIEHWRRGPLAPSLDPRRSALFQGMMRFIAVQHINEYAVVYR